MSLALRILPSRIENIVGADNLSMDAAQLARCEVDGMQPQVVARPGAAAETVELVRYAAAEKLGVIPCGGGTKLTIGMPPRQFHIAVDMTRMNSVVAYDAGDLTLAVEAGMKLKDLQRALARENQFLPLAVPFGENTTIGGTVAMNMDSPLRQRYGTARDFVLGMEFVTGEGELAKSGGRVVKNVTGYDLHKLMIGAMGTLGIITRINFKTFPLPEASRGFRAVFGNVQSAVEMRRRIAQSPLAPQTVELLDARMVEILRGSRSADSAMPIGRPSDTSWAVLVSCAGRSEVLDRCERDLARMAEEAMAEDFRVSDENERRITWERLPEAIPLALAESPDATILKIITSPAGLAKVISRLHENAASREIPSAVVARGVGVIYFALLPSANHPQATQAVASVCEDIFEASGNETYRAIVEWCPRELKTMMNIWGPDGGDASLMEKVKTVFDPHGIFSPGRFAGAL
jgi:glycolate oxidase FAD binding subunit